MKGRITWTVGIVTLVALAAGWATAQPGAMAMQRGRGQRGAGQRGGGRGGDGMERIVGAIARNPEIAAELGLSEEQIAALRKAQYEQRLKMLGLESDLGKLRLTQRHLLEQDDVDEAKILANVDEIAAKNAELARLRMQHALALRKILTPEQRRKAKEQMRARVRRRMQARADGKGNARGQHGKGMRQRGMRRRGFGADEPGTADLDPAQE